MAQRNETIDQLVKSLGAPDAGSERSLSGEIAALFTSPAADGSGQQQAGSSTEAVSQNTAALTQIQSLMQTLVATTTEITKGIANNTAAASGSGSSSDLASTIAGAVTSGLSLNPIVSGLLQLFGGGSQTDAPAALTKFSLPSSLSLDVGLSGGVAGPADYGQNGLPRSPSTAPATNVTVQVNALDSRSILDRSDDIASAVRRAMLESSALNDVVSEI